MSRISLKEFSSPSAQQHLPPSETEPVHCSAEHLLNMALESIAFFNERQQRVFNKMMNSVMPEVGTDHLDAEPSLRFIRSHLFVFNAFERTETPFITSAIQRFLKSQGKQVVTLVSSALASRLSFEELSAYSALRIPITVYQESMCTVPVDLPLKADLQQTYLIVWDESLMTRRYNLEAVDLPRREITRFNLPFDENTMLLIGDFCERLPVVRVGSRSHIV